MFLFTLSAEAEKLKRSILEKIGDEWHGEGLLLGRGAFSEVLWGALITPAIGIALLCSGITRHKSNGFHLLFEFWPFELVIIACLLSGLLTIVGLSLFYIQGRCIVSRWCRLAGATIGLMLWLSVFLLSAIKNDGQISATIVYAGMVLAFLRATTLAGRRI